MKRLVVTRRFTTFKPKLQQERVLPIPKQDTKQQLPELSRGRDSYEPTLADYSLCGKRIVVTGAAGGLGTILCQAILQSGGSVVLVDHSRQRVDEVSELLWEWYSIQGGFKRYKHVDKQSTQPYVCDISQDSDVKQVFNDIGKLGTIDGLVNTAGFTQTWSTLDYPADAAKRLIDVNLMGSLYCARETARLLIKHKRPGSIVLVASMSGHIVNTPQPQAPYNMSKAGVRHLAASLAVEWAQYSIRVNSLSPGYILTPLTRSLLASHPQLKETWERLTPLGRMGDPAEFAGPVVFMLSNAASFMTGSDLAVDGGYLCF